MPESSQTERVDVALPDQQADGAAGIDAVQAPNVVVDDLAIEDVSIDGMCGVY